MQRSVSESKVNGEASPSASAMARAGIVQEQIWFQEEWTPKIGVYNIPTALRLVGRLRPEALQAALNDIVRRHDTLHTSFVGHGANLSQVLCEPETLTLPVVDLTNFSSGDRDRALRQRLRCEARKPFNLRKEALLRAVLFRLAPQEHVLFINMHHIISDEWSVRVLLGELKTCYEARAAGREPSLPELPIQYADYAEWQRERLSQGQAGESLDYWREELKGDLPHLEFPADHPAPHRRTYEGERTAISLGGELSEQVHRFARETQTTPFTVLFAAWQALLARYTGHTDILSGTAVAGRIVTETEPLIGLFSNLLVLRNRVEAETTFASLAAEVREKTLNAFTHQDIPFDKVVAAVRPERDSLQMPLIQSVFTFQNELLEADAWDGVRVEWMEMDNGTSKFDLTATAIHAREELRVVLEFNTDLFERAAMERFLGHYRGLLRAVLKDPTQPVRRVDFLAEPERRLLLQDWNATKVDYPREKTIHAVFEEQAARTPHAAAIVFGGETWSYQQLNQRAEELAATLRALGAGPEVMIGICMKRSYELVLALLAILKTGACYVPLDPDYPTERLEFMMRDARAPLLLTQTQLQHKLPETDARVIAVHETEFASAPPPSAAAAAPVSAENAAYVMYTSGSTGRPKGVIVTHRNVVRLVCGANYVRLGPGETLLQYAPISFDASTFEIWGALLTGGTLCIMPSGRVSLEELADAIAEFKVTTLWLTTGLFNVMVDEHPEALRPLRQLLTGGEAGSIPHLRKYLENAPAGRLIHCYGPTENTTFTTTVELTLDSLADEVLPIGKPISNTKVFILDPFLQPVPIGVAGELFTSGDGVARGYLNAPELTSDRFIPHPFQRGQRLYRTGDLARWLPDGNVHYLGRLDRQVKVRGFRIELGEIERALASHPAVAEAVVIAEEKTSAEKRLIAYWKSEGPRPGEEELRAHLARSLPEFMVPHVFVPLEELPLDPNGKVDRGALPPPPTTRKAGTGFQPPRTDLELALAGIWQETLGLANIGLQDNFFHLGGHSLLATQIISRIRRTLQLEVPLRTIFDHPTLGGFAGAAAGQKAVPGTDTIRPGLSAAEAEDLLTRLDELSDEEVDRLLRAHSS